MSRAESERCRLLDLAMNLQVELSDQEVRMVMGYVFGAAQVAKASHANHVLEAVVAGQRYALRVRALAAEEFRRTRTHETPTQTHEGTPPPDNTRRPVVDHAGREGGSAQPSTATHPAHIA